MQIFPSARQLLFLCVLMIQGLLSASAFAQYANNICRPLARHPNHQWISGDRVNWNRVAQQLPGYLRLAQRHARQREQILQRVSFINPQASEADVRRYLDLRGCDLTQIESNPAGMCANYKVYCIYDQATTQMGRQMERFAYCARVFGAHATQNRNFRDERGRRGVPSVDYIRSDCGQSFTTMAGLRSNLETLMANKNDIQRIINSLDVGTARSRQLQRFLDSISTTFDEVEAQVQASERSMAAELARIDAARREREAAIDRRLRAADEAMAVFRDCPTYLEREGIRNMDDAVDVFSDCPLDPSQATGPEVRTLIAQLRDISAHAGQGVLIELTNETQRSNLHQTIRAYLTVYKGRHGRLPTCQQFSANSCEHPTVKTIFAEELRRPELVAQPALNLAFEVRQYARAQEIDRDACRWMIEHRAGRAGDHIVPWARENMERARDFAQHSVIGRLMALDNFRQRYGTVDLSKCARGGSVLPDIQRLYRGESAEEAAQEIAGLTDELLAMFKSATEEIVDDQRTIDERPARANRILEAQMRTNPDIVREALASSSNPREAALWMCRLTRDEGRDTQRMQTVSTVGKAVGMAAGVVALIGSGGTAAPLIAGGAAIVGTGGAVTGALIDATLAARDEAAAEEDISRASGDLVMNLRRVAAAEQDMSYAIMDGVLALPIYQIGGAGARGVTNMLGRVQGLPGVSDDAVRNMTALFSAGAEASADATARSREILGRILQRTSANPNSPAYRRMQEAMAAMMAEVPQEVSMEFMVYLAVAPEDVFTEQGFESLLTSASLSAAFSGAGALRGSEPPLASVRRVLERFRTPQGGATPDGTPARVAGAPDSDPNSPRRTGDSEAALVVDGTNPRTAAAAAPAVVASPARANGLGGRATTADSATRPPRAPTADTPPRWRDRTRLARRVTHDTFPVGNRDDFANWSRTLERIPGTNNPFRGTDGQAQARRLVERMRADVAALTSDPTGTLPHMAEHRELARRYADELGLVGMDREYFLLLQEAHDLGKYFPSARDTVALRAQFTGDGEFRYPAIPNHDIGTSEYLLRVGAELDPPIDPRRIEHLLADIAGHNDGSGLPDVFWNQMGWPRGANGAPYPTPSSREGWMLTILDRFGQGTLTGAQKISGNVAGFSPPDAPMRGAIMEGYGLAPTNTIRQLQAIEERFIAFSRTDPSGRPPLTDPEVVAVRRIIDDGMRTQNATVQFLDNNVRWSADGRTATLIGGDGQPIRVNGQPLTASSVAEFNDSNSPFGQRVAALIDGHLSGTPPHRKELIIAAEVRTERRHRDAIAAAEASLPGLAPGSPERARAEQTIASAPALAADAAERIRRTRRGEAYLVVENGYPTATPRTTVPARARNSASTGAATPSANTPQSRTRTTAPVPVTDANRISVAQRMLDRRRDFTTAETQAIWDAHNHGTGGLGNYSLAEIREKHRILQRAGFTSPEIRTLMESGITGVEVPRFTIPDPNSFRSYTAYAGNVYRIPANDPQAPDMVTRGRETPSVERRLFELGRHVRDVSVDMRAYLPRNPDGSQRQGSTVPTFTVHVPRSQAERLGNHTQYTAYLIDERTLEIDINGTRRRVPLSEVVENFDRITTRPYGAREDVVIMDNSGTPLVTQYGLESPYLWEK